MKPPQSAQWKQERQELVELKRRWSPMLVSMPVRVRFEDPDGNFSVSGRGAVAVLPPEAMRMILVGPTGSTAMDIWIRDKNWRVAFPVQGKIVRGNALSTPEESQGLPVGFLRWWFLTPLEGQLLAVHTRAEGRSFVLREDDAVIEATELKDGSLRIDRSNQGEHERVLISRPGCGTAVYEHRERAVKVEVVCDQQRGEGGHPDPRAFDDPDLPPPRHWVD